MKRGKKQSFCQLKTAERHELGILLQRGYGIREIARTLKRSPGTISEEVKRNRRKILKRQKWRAGTYDSEYAAHKAYVRRKYSKYQGKKIQEDTALQTYIVEKLKHHWSPDAISGKMRREKKVFYASKTAIYEWLYSAWGQRHCPYLYSRRYRPKKRKGVKTRKTLIPCRKGIEERPPGAKNRSRYSHYEADTVVSGRKTGSRTALSVIYERKARYVDIRKIPNMRSVSNLCALKEMTQRVIKTKSITFDNGAENTCHRELQVPTFFCDTYSAWQKGGVENVIKMIRRYVPKGSDINSFSHAYIRRVVEILNNKPRKSLNYDTPYEIMKKKRLLVEH